MQQQNQQQATGTELQFSADTRPSTFITNEARVPASLETTRSHAREEKQTAALAEIIRYRKQAKTRYAANLIFGLLLMLFFLCANLFLSAAGQVLLLPFIILGCGVCSLSLFAVTWFQMRSSEQTIASIDDIRMIGPLAEAWSAERFLKPKPIVAALCRLLPRLQASDANLLTREQRTCLYHAINWRAGRPVYQYDRKLTVAILQALQQIGDKEALPYVRRAAHSMHKDTRNAANDCLGFLVEQAEQHNRSAMYLRPADARTSAPEVLLRPSTGMTASQQTPPEELLRAHNQE